MQKVIVLEVNEVSLRIFHHFAERYPGSAVARLIAESSIAETVAQDVETDALYPSQTWASFNSGAPYARHRIHWYNDPKPAEYPMYWRSVAASRKTVGLVNTLHASPAAEFREDPGYPFVIPDCFATDSEVKPDFFRPFQTINLHATASSGRVAKLSAPFGDLMSCVALAPRMGISAKTVRTSIATVAKVLSKNINAERIRNLQFLAMGDIFSKLTRRHDPDLAILFTNHIAANMHRYWYALFPDDYTSPIYDTDWQRKYADEIMYSIQLFDDYLEGLMDFVDRTDRILIVASSMGQCANSKLTREHRISNSFAFRLDDPAALVGILSTRGHGYKVRQGMVPQYTLEFESAANARQFGDDVTRIADDSENIWLLSDVNDATVTLSVNPSESGDPVTLNGRQYSAEDLGFTRFTVDNHHSGHHHPSGSLIVYNSRSANFQTSQIDYLEYAPAMLQHFGIDRAPFMKSPSFAI